MNRMGLKGKRPKEKYHSYRGEVGKIADNIISRNFKADKPDEKWTTDVSQFSLPFGKCYLSPILDMYTNEIISYDLSLHPNYEQITNMLDRAFEDHPDLKGLIFHSDQGWQYQMKEYRKALEDKGQPDKYLIAMKYLETLKTMTDGKDNKVVYMPYEATGILSSVDGIKQMFDK